MFGRFVIMKNKKIKLYSNELTASDISVSEHEAYDVMLAAGFDELSDSIFRRANVCETVCFDSFDETVGYVLKTDFKRIYIASRVKKSFERSSEDELADILCNVQKFLSCSDRSVTIIFVSCNESGRISAESLLVGTDRSLRMLSDKIRIKYMVSDEKDPLKLAYDVIHEYGEALSSEVHYRNRIRYVRALKELEISHGRIGSRPHGGSILISGGMGGLSVKCARYLLEHTDNSIMLVGRSRLSGERVKLYSSLFSQYSDRISYVSADVCERRQLEEIFSYITSNGLKLRGVIHAAGINDGKFFHQKSRNDFIMTERVKMTGTALLSEFAEGQGAEFFAAFSSLSAYDGDFGQADYSAANLYLDRFAEKRNSVQNRCRYISIGWPLWRNGGMHLAPEAEKNYLKLNGYDYLEDSEGAEILLELIESDMHGCVTVKKFKSDQNSLEETSMADRDFIEKRLAAIIEEITGIAPDMLDMELGFGEMGFDSIGFNSFSKRINETFDTHVLPIDFFQYATPKKFSAYLSGCGTSEKTSDAVMKKSAAFEEKAEPRSAFTFAVFDDPADSNVTADENKTDIRTETFTPSEKTDFEPIAVIGMAGIFPDADNTDEYWNNLIGRKCSISDIPEERLGKNKGFEKNEINGYHIRAGFLKNIGGFDAEFFKMIPKDCEYMDPQQRLYIETVYSALEDAGFVIQGDYERSVGVFTGIQHADYKKLLLERNICDSTVALGNEPSMISNRISFIFDFSGPSVSVNTACSSSLAAVHNAVVSLQRRECRLAVAGGVSIYNSPDSFGIANKMGILSDYGQCRAFDDSAAGYVKGEGVGAVVLKPLSEAVKDNDHVYCVIRGSFINHGGHAQSVTSPNEAAQTALLRKTMDIAGVTPDTIAFAELHGTGTHLGDPVEVSAMKKAYEGAPIGSCYIGSVKNNIGHLEPASGIAGMIKSILCITHRQVPAVVNFSRENHYLGLAASPFVINTETVRLTRKRKNGAEIPLRASVSSFGFGGTNCNIILEEHIGNRKRNSVPDKNIFVLSALNKQRLDMLAVKFISFLKGYSDRTEDEKKTLLCDICYTLRSRRRQDRQRLAIVCGSFDGLLSTLSLYTEGKTSDNMFYGNCDDENSRFRSIFDDEGAVQYLLYLKKSGNLNKIAACWVMGMNVDWNEVGDSGTAVSLPTSPFIHKYYWFDSYKQNNSKMLPNPNVSFHVDDDKPVSLYTVDDNIAVLSLCDRKHKNMFSEELISHLKSSFDAVRKNKNIKVLIVTGYDNIFCMGGSKEELLELQSGKSNFADASVIYKGILELDIPVISAMQGSAFGGGLAFGLYGDIVIMAEEAFYSANFMKYGFTPGLGSTYILKQKLGENLANYMMFSADILTGGEIAMRNAPVIVRKSEEVISMAVDMARKIAKSELNALSLLKKSVSGEHMYMLDRAVENELEMHSQTIVTVEAKERINKFFVDPAADKNDRENVKAKPVVLTHPAEDVSVSHGGKIKLSGLNASPKSTRSEPDIMPAADKGSPAEDSLGSVAEYIAYSISDILHIDVSEVNMDSSLTDNGVDSIYNIEFIRRLNRHYGIDLDVVEVYEYSTLNEFAAKVNETISKSNSVTAVKTEMRTAAPAEQEKTQAAPAPKPSCRDNTEHISELIDIVCDVLHIEPSAVSIDESFSDLGMDSINLIEFTRQINKSFGTAIDASELYDVNTISALSSMIFGLRENSGLSQAAVKGSTGNFTDDELLAILSSIDADSDLDKIDSILGGLK